VNEEIVGEVGVVAVEVEVVERGRRVGRAALRAREEDRSLLHDLRLFPGPVAGQRRHGDGQVMRGLHLDGRPGAPFHASARPSMIQTVDTMPWPDTMLTRSHRATSCALVSPLCS
jgi:hypothetical protein